MGRGWIRYYDGSWSGCPRGSYTNELLHHSSYTGVHQTGGVGSGSTSEHTRACSSIPPPRVCGPTQQREQLQGPHQARISGLRCAQLARVLLPPPLLRYSGSPTACPPRTALPSGWLSPTEAPPPHTDSLPRTMVCSPTLSHPPSDPAVSSEQANLAALGLGRPSTGHESRLWGHLGIPSEQATWFGLALRRPRERPVGSFGRVQCS
jgi:hypothetical protein